MLKLCRYLIVFLPLTLHAQAGAPLFSSASAADPFLATNPGATLVSAGQSGLTFRTPKGMVLFSGNNLTYQDNAGKWQVTKQQIDVDGHGGWVQSGTPVNISLVGGGPAKHLKIGKGNAMWDLTLPGTAYSKNADFTFQTGGQNWTLHVLPHGTEMDATVTAKQGSKTYTFEHAAGGASVAVDKNGNLIVAGDIITRRAAMVRGGRRDVPLWSMVGH
jgi:hypothetical protein